MIKHVGDSELITSSKLSKASKRRQGLHDDSFLLQ